MRSIAVPSAALLLFFSTPGSAFAGSATWAAAPSSGDWNTAGNWTPITVPNGAGDIATFGQSNTPGVSLTANTQVSGITFTPSASAYTIISGPALVLTITGVGITNDSGIVQNLMASANNMNQFGIFRFVNDATAGSLVHYTNSGGSANQGFFGPSGGMTEFHNGSTAGTATFVNNGGLTFLASGGMTVFSNTASASNANFVNAGGVGSGASGGLTQFRDSSTAANGTFTNTKGSDSNTQGGRLEFRGNSNAGNALITNNGAVVSGAGTPWTFFFDTASAANATLTNLGGADVSQASGGAIDFDDMSNAGNAVINNRAATVAHAAGGRTRFLHDSNAANSTIINNGGTMPNQGGGVTLFFNNSTAGNSIVVAEGGSNGGFGGSIMFLGDNGGLGQMKVFGNGFLDLRNGPFPGVTIGSLEGTGNVFLGNRTLGVGVNNLNTNFSGVIQDFSSGNPGSLTKVGTGTLTLSGASSYNGATTVNAGTLFVKNATGSGTGTGPVTVNNSGSVLGGTGTITGPVVVNAQGILSGGDATAASGSLKLANNLALNANSIIELGLGASGAHSSLSRTGGTWTFASNQAFRFVNRGAQPGVYDNIITGLAGDPGGTGSWTITTPGFTGSFAYDGSGNIDLTLTAAPAAAPGPTPTVLANVATRLPVGTGDNALIGGFIVTGTQQKKVIIRAIAPSLGIPGQLANPTLELFSGQTSLGANDDWMNSSPADKQAILDSGIPPTHDLESAIVRTLPANGAGYTAVVRGVNNATGIAVVEIYDLDDSVDSKLANISTRGFVQTGDNVLFAGTIVLGTTPQRVIIRAIGPSLTIAGKMPDPTMELRDANGGLIRANDNWRVGGQEADIIASTIPPSHDSEAAIVADLPANGASYTAIVRGVGNTTGIAVVEVYALQ